MPYSCLVKYSIHYPIDYTSTFYCITSLHALGTILIYFRRGITLYGWWLLEEGTSRNVPIAGFEMILRDLYSSRNIISNPKILGTFRDVPDNKVAICYIVWLPIALPGFGIARRNYKTQYFFQRGFPLSCAQCNAYPLYCAPQCNAYPLYGARNKKPVRG